MTKHFLIVGKRFRGLTDYLSQHGHTYTLLADQVFNFKPIGNIVKCDFYSQQSLLDCATSINKDHKIDGVLVTYENYILPAAIIANHLGLPGLPVEAAKACTDKNLMRQLFMQAPQNISPGFASIGSEKDVREFAKNHAFPLMLKPANLAKSLLVTKNHDLTELIDNYRQTVQQIDKIYQKYAPQQTPSMLIEEYMEGSIHSVDAFVDATGNPEILENVVDYRTGYDVGYDDNFHYSRRLPSKLSPKNIELIREVAGIGCASLGIKNSPAHIEVILTRYGPKIVEIGARNGGYRERMHGTANGIDITGNAIKLALGEKVNVQPVRHDNCAVLELFPKISGMFDHVSHQDDLMNLPSMEYFKQKVSEGQPVGKSSLGHKMCAVIMLHNSDSLQFEHDLEFVERNVQVITRPN